MAYSLYSAIPKKPLNSIFISSPNFIFNTVNKHITCVTPSIFPRLRGYCTWVSAVSSSVAEKDEHLSRHASPGIVAKEYADLNLPEKISEVWNFFLKRLHFYNFFKYNVLLCWVFMYGCQLILLNIGLN